MDCNHPVQIAGMCAVCGKTLDDDAINQASISMMHDHAGVKVSAEEAQRLDSESTSHLLEQRKLALIVDLDQTIIHATVDPTVGEWMKDENNPNNQALKDVGKFRLGMDGKAINDSPETENQDGGGAAIDQRGCWYYIKPRPGLQSFLKDLSRKYELHVYTMGTRSYADCVCKLVDPDGSLFATRILSRDENGSLDEKSLSRLFPVDTSMVVIIDDRADVWRWSPNLVKVKPFDFFVGIGDINATFLPAAPRSPAPTLPDPTVAPGASESSSSLTLPVASASTALSFTEATSGSSSASLSSPDSSAVDPKGRGDATRDAEAVEVAAMRSQTTALTEQRDARPLAKMQEALDEKLAHTPAVAEAERIDAQKRSSSQDVSLPANGKGKEKAEAEPEPKGAEEQEEEAKEGQEKAPDDVSAMPPDVPNLDAAFTGNHNSHAVLRDDDRELDRLRKILDEIHEQWYSSWESLRKEEEANADAPRDKNLNLPAHKKPTVMEIIAGLKAQVLKDCKIVFSSLVPLGQAPETSEFWRLAQEFGAKCFKEVDHTITHVIASRLGTAKVNKAHRHQDIHVVWPRWLHDTVAEWERRPEVFYAVPPGPHLHLFTGTSGELESIPLVASIATADDANETSSESSSLGTSNELGNGQAEGDFTQMDWALANDEVDAFLDDDEDEDDETEAETEADLVSEGDATDGEKSSAGSSRPKVKRPRTQRGGSRSRAPRASSSSSSEGEDDGADPDLLRSPLSKRRKVAEERAGQSRLKESMTISSVEGEVADAVEEANGLGKGEVPSAIAGKSQADTNDETAIESKVKDKPSPMQGLSKEEKAPSDAAALVGQGEGGTDSDDASLDESFLDDLANEMEMQMGDDDDNDDKDGKNA